MATAYTRTLETLASGRHIVPDVSLFLLLSLAALSTVFTVK